VAFREDRRGLLQLGIETEQAGKHITVGPAMRRTLTVSLDPAQWPLAVFHRSWRRLVLLALLSAVMPLAARANCTSSGTTVSCDSSPPNPFTSTIGTGPSTAPGTTVTLGPNAQVVPVGNLNAISLARSDKSRSNSMICCTKGGIICDREAPQLIGYSLAVGTFRHVESRRA
jgi:hypothetical protein